MKIAVAGTGYVRMSVALLLSQHNEVHALDIVPEKVELLNNGKSPIVDSKITAFLDADPVRRAAVGLPGDARPGTGVYGSGLRSDSHADELRRPEELLRHVQRGGGDRGNPQVRQTAWIVIKSTIPVGYTQQIRERVPTMTVSCSLWNSA